MKVEFFPIDEKRNSLLKYSIIAARFQLANWIFVRHKSRDTWEIPGGHIEFNEHPDDAAKRELYEETGAVKYSLHPITDYTVTRKNDIGYGRLYFAEVEVLGELPDSEISEIIILDSLPDNLTYEYIQKTLFDKILQKIKEPP